MASAPENQEKSKIEKRRKKIRNRLRSFFRSTKRLKDHIFRNEDKTRSDGPTQRTGGAMIKEYPLVREDATPWEEDPENVYNFGHKFRGLAVLFLHCNFDIVENNRDGAFLDKYIFTKVFESLGFDVRVYHDLSTMDVENTLLDLRSRQITPEMDCFVCGISSHGTAIPDKGFEKRTTHYFYTRDSMMPTGDVVESFTDRKCPNLKGKPKMFFVQACRTLFRGEKKTDRGHTLLIDKNQPWTNPEQLTNFFSSALDPQKKNDGINEGTDLVPRYRRHTSVPDAKPDPSKYNDVQIHFEFPQAEESEEDDETEDEERDEDEEKDIDQILDEIFRNLDQLQNIEIPEEKTSGSSENETLSSPPEEPIREKFLSHQETTSEVDPIESDALGKITPHGYVSTKTREYLARNSPQEIREITPRVLGLQQSLHYRPYYPNGEALTLKQFLKDMQDYDYCHIPSDKDFLLMFSSAPDYVAWRNIGYPESGSWLFLALSQALHKWQKKAFDGDFLSFLTTACHEMATMETGDNIEDDNYSFCKSTAHIYHQLVKDIVFYPKIPKYIT